MLRQLGSVAGYRWTVKPAWLGGLRGLRASLVGSLACGVVLLVLISHDVRPVLEPGHAHDAAMLAGLCSVVLGLLAPLFLRAARPGESRLAAVPVLTTSCSTPMPLRSDARSRASPASLQHFRN
jgi:hypothetical protein